MPVISPDPSSGSDSDQMRYAMLGEDAGSTEEKLEKYVGQVPWSYLVPHYKAGSLFFVDPGLDLKEVGAAIADNQADVVEAWLKSGDLVKIEAIHAGQWEGSKTQFEALVVSPFVLCRPV